MEIYSQSTLEETGVCQPCMPGSWLSNSYISGLRVGPNLWVIIIIIINIILINSN